jgi:hypothetical protein
VSRYALPSATIAAPGAAPPYSTTSWGGCSASREWNTAPSELDDASSKETAAPPCTAAVTSYSTQVPDPIAPTSSRTGPSRAGIAFQVSVDSVQPVAVSYTAGPSADGLRT